MRIDFDLPCKAIACALSLTTLLLAGCDENSAPDNSTATPVETKPVAPTRENKTLRRVKLEAAPFTVEIPGDWDVGPAPLMSAIVLRGPKAEDDPQGFLARQGSIHQYEEISVEHANSMIATFKTDSDKEGNTDVMVYEMGPITAVEINHHGMSVTTQPSEVSEKVVQQTFHLFGPGTDGKRTWSEIRFAHAPVAEFEAQQETLRKIIKSLELQTTETESPIESETTEPAATNTTQPALP